MLFNEPQTLIVVYKEELYSNFLKKLVETNDDNGDDAVVGTRDGSVHIVAWTEKVWRDQKKAGNINNKVLFLGDVKGTDKLLPIIDVKYNEFGILFGWAGNQAVLHVNSKELLKNGYTAFFDQFCELAVPVTMKTSAVKESKAKDNATANLVPTEENSEEKRKKSKVAKAIGNVAVAAGVALFNPVAGAVTAAAEAGVNAVKSVNEYAKVQQQQFIYGICKMYEDHLEEFMTK